MMHDAYVSNELSAGAPGSQATASSNIAAKKALDTFTIMKSTLGPGSASKSVVADEHGRLTVIGFNAGAFFRAFEVGVSNIEDLSVMLKVVEEQRDCFVIRGAPRPDLNTAQPQRRRKTNFRTPALGRGWVLIDFDKIVLPQGMSLQQDIGAVCEYLVALLPSEFHQASFHWQLSSSAGITDPSIVSVHLWFWLDRPIPDAELKAWAKHWNEMAGRKLIDPALFNDVQAHYTAAPIFDGMADPFPVRSGLVRKAVDEVALRLPRPRETRPIRSRVKTLEPSGGFEAILEQIGDHEGGQGFHQPIIRAAASYAATHGRDGTNIEALYEVISARVLAADRSKHDDAYVEEMASREHIVRAIEQAISKYGKPDPRRKSRQIEGVEPHFPSKPLGAAEAFAKLRRVVYGHFGLRQ